MYGNILSSLASGSGPAGTPPASLGKGPVPAMPDLPPPATGVGAMPVGNATNDAKAAQDDAIAKLRDLQGMSPSLAPQIDGWISQIKQVALPPAPPAAVPGAAAPPGAPPDSSQVMQSGGDGS